MPEPPGYTFLTRLPKRVRDACPGRRQYPTMNQIRSAAWDGKFKTEYFGNRIAMPDCELPVVIEVFGDMLKDHDEPADAAAD